MIEGLRRRASSISKGGCISYGRLHDKTKSFKRWSQNRGVQTELHGLLNAWSDLQSEIPVTEQVAYA